MKVPLAVVIIALLSAFGACRSAAPDAASTNQAGGKTFTDLLAAQLETVGYPSVITRDGEMVTVRIGGAAASQVRRALCRAQGWPAGNQMIRLDETLRRLRLAEGVTHIRLVGQNETLDVRLGGQGKCER